MKSSELIKHIENGGLDGVLSALYGSGRLEGQRARYLEAVGEFIGLYGERDVSLFSVPGRSEISGNHTDHQRGRVIAAAVDLDIIAVASENGTGKITVKSKGFTPDICTAEKHQPDASKYETSQSLLEGVVTGFLNAGHKAAGFDAYTTSDVFKGSGLSSSAAYEDMIGNILNHFANGGKIPAPEIAVISKYAENVHFGKPSGLMDQTACAVGGFAFIDFGNPEKAEIEKLGFGLTEAGYSLCITDTGGNHADLTGDYASVPQEMKSVAALFGKDVLRGITKAELIEKAPLIREKCGDRAFLRAYHFIGENERVLTAADCLRNRDLNGFLDCILESGRSSFMWLQNVYTTKNVGEQGLSLALAVSEEVLGKTERKSAYRVHGGGFAGTVQAFVPNENVEEYVRTVNGVFGEGKCHVLKIRPEGAIRLDI